LAFQWISLSKDFKIKEESRGNSMTSFKEKLSSLLLQAGARPGSFSIDDPKNYALNFEGSSGTYTVWFQEGSINERYESKTYSVLEQAVYEFATRLVHSDAARQIASQFV
jgi:hypothetical protein